MDSPTARRPEAPDILIISAPSGAGKTSLARALIEQCPEAALSVSHTTRPRRPGETEGRDYHFVSPDAFDTMVANGEFVEHARVFDHAYGTSCAALRALTATGKCAILEIDWQGARRVRAAFPGSRSVFVKPPSLAALAERLEKRRQDSAEVIARRLEEAVAEMAHADEYDHILVNDEFDATLAELKRIFRGRADSA